MARVGLAAVCLLLISACGGGGGGNPAPVPPAAPPAPPVLSIATLAAVARPNAVELRWNAVAATTFNVYRAEAAGCDFANYATCPGGTLTSNAPLNAVQRDLVNGKSYWFKVEARDASGAAVWSNETSARPDQLTARQVRAIAVGDDGTTYLGGEFQSVGVATGQGVQIDVATGQPTASPFVEGNVFAAVSDGSGGWYIGGDFTRVGGLQRHRLAHVRADRTVGSWAPAVGGAGHFTVQALALVGDTLYFGGVFEAVNGQPRSGLAAVGTDGTLRALSPQIGASGSPLIHALAIEGDVVYFGGIFTTVNGQPRERLAAVGMDGALRPWNPGVDNLVRSIGIADGIVYVAGDFTTLGGAPRNYAGAVGLDGSVQSWNPAPNRQVEALVAERGAVYLAGIFNLVAGQPRQGFAVVATDGTILGREISVGGVASELSVDGDTVYIGGQFTSIQVGLQAATRNGLAAVSADGTTLRGWSPTTDGVPQVLAASAGSVYVGGYFSHVNGTQRQRLAAIAPDGTLATWAPRALASVDALTVVGDTVFAGGEFTGVWGSTSQEFAPRVRQRLAAFRTGDGALLPWDPQADGAVRAFAASGDTLFVGGEFSTVAGQPRARLAAIGGDGTLRAWNPGVDAEVRALAIAGTDVYVGGAFTTVAGQARSRMAVVGSDGALRSWNVAFDLPVQSIAIDGGTVYVAGDFILGTIPQPSARQGLAAFDLSGALTGWNPGFIRPVNSVAAAGGVVYLAGPFGQVLGQPRRHLAAIGVDGLLRSWQASALDQSIRALLVRDGRVRIGGSYAVVDAAAP